MQIPHADYFRNAAPSDPQFSRKLAAVIDAINQQSAITEQQGNLSSAGQPAPPPNIQSVTATGANGVLHVSIEDQSAGLNRGVEYFAEHSAFPDFRDSQVRPMGTSRSADMQIGNATRYVRAYSAYPSSTPSEHAYHGSAISPSPVSGGGSIGPPAWLPSQGSGTGGPGQFGVGPGLLPKRTVESGVQWTGRAGNPSGPLSTGIPVFPSGNGFSPAGGGGGGSTPSISENVIAPCEWLSSVAGTNTVVAVTATPYSALGNGFLVRFVPANTNNAAVTLNVNSIGAKAVTKNGTTALAGGELQAGRAYVLEYDGIRWQIIGASFPVSALVLASDANGNPAPAVLADTKIWIGQGTGLPAAETIGGDATLADNGTLTLATVNGSPGTFGDSSHVAQVTVNAKGLATAVSSVAIVFPPTFASVTLTPSTIAALPGAPSPGQLAAVNNALAPMIGTAVAGPGTAFAAVCWNGSQWTVFSV